MTDELDPSHKPVVTGVTGVTVSIRGQRGKAKDHWLSPL